MIRGSMSIFHNPIPDRRRIQTVATQSAQTVWGTFGVLDG